MRSSDKDALLRTVVLIELNEVPNEVLDAYAEKSSPFMKKFLAASDRYTTVCADRIQLDPWISWPTFHRGVNDATHNLLRLGQDTDQIDQEFPPVWRILRDAGLKVGVYGSLFSSAESAHEGYSFFVPDVFSPHSRIKPSSLTEFQQFNLDMTRASARNVDDGVSQGGAKSVLNLVRSRFLTLSTMSRLARQLLSEKLDHKKVSRRRNSQTELHADIFAKLLQKERPNFATFYTNNVAAAMHRFWSASVPGAKLNDERLSKDWKANYRDEVFEALFSVERLIKRLTSGELGDVKVVIASSLGQEEIPAENYDRFLTIRNIGTFVNRLLDDHTAADRVEIIPTMVPDFSLRFANAQETALVNEKLKTLSLGQYAAVETLERMHATELLGAEPRFQHIRHVYESEDGFKHAITFKRSDDRTLHLSFQIDDYSGPGDAQLGNEHIPFAELGIGYMSHDEGVNCTAQHSALGSLTIWPPADPEHPQQSEKQISTLDFVPSILSRFGVRVPDYMSGLNSIDFSGEGIGGRQPRALGRA